jgi:hypothetical protein
MRRLFYKIMAFLFSILFRRDSYYYPRYRYYERLLEKYSDGTFYSRLIHKIKSVKGRETKTSINHIEHKPFKETSITDIIKKHGKPNYKIIYDDLLNIKVLFYREKLGKHKTKLEFHFFNEQLFFYTYTFSYLNNDDKNELVDILEEKYLEGEKIDMKGDFIVDDNNNIILINDKQDFSIYYICDNRIALESIKEHIDSIKKRARQEKSKYKKILYRKL